MARPWCERCARPQTHCLCPLIPVLDNATRVLLLQHPDERDHALNTARFVALGLRNVDYLVGEYFPQLAQFLQGGRPLLLFPGEPAFTAQQWQEKADAAPTILVVLDGTWRKTRKLLHLNPVLSELPRLSLGEPQPSRYRLRKAREPHSLATVEATVQALNLLEGDGRFDPLLKPFEAMIEGQIQSMGSGVYRKNHAPEESA